MRIVVTGADGFIGRNLRVALAERGHADVATITRATSAAALREAMADADFVFHLAGVNRPRDEDDFERGNVDLTRTVCDALAAAGRAAPIVFSSSTQAALDTPYGRSKRAAEVLVEGYAAATGAPVFVLRLTNVFGKWSRPEYNSAVATFSHNVGRGLPIQINDPAAVLRLLYIDDLIDAMTRRLDPSTRLNDVPPGPVYETTVGELAEIIRGFADSRRTLLTPRVGAGLVRALYATYLSYLPPAAFAYPLLTHADPRGVFVEMLKTPDTGQFSYFTAHPGVTRGGHYHHTKTEKFLVVSGAARFGFRHLVSNERHEMVVEGGTGQVVETVPGWAHDITNVGDVDMVVLLWANEVFDPAHPDTVAARVLE